jgi:hypothetical protein
MKTEIIVGIMLFALILFALGTDSRSCSLIGLALNFVGAYLTSLGSYANTISVPPVPWTEEPTLRGKIKLLFKKSNEDRRIGAIFSGRNFTRPQLRIYAARYGTMLIVVGASIQAFAIYADP